MFNMQPSKLYFRILCTFGFIWNIYEHSDISVDGSLIPSLCSICQSVGFIRVMAGIGWSEVRCFGVGARGMWLVLEVFGWGVDPEQCIFLEELIFCGEIVIFFRYFLIHFRNMKTDSWDLSLSLTFYQQHYFFSPCLHTIFKLQESFYIILAKNIFHSISLFQSLSLGTISSTTQSSFLYFLLTLHQFCLFYRWYRNSHKLLPLAVIFF